MTYILQTVRQTADETSYDLKGYRYPVSFAGTLPVEGSLSACLNKHRAQIFERVGVKFFL